MKAEIKNEVFEKISENFTAGILLCQGIDNKTPHEEIEALLRDIEELVRVSLSKEGISHIKEISEWEKSTSGLKFYSAIEKMMKEVADGKEIESRNKLADLCSFIALKHIVNCTALDASKIKNITFSVKDSEIEVKDGEKVLFRKEDYRSLVSANTKKAVIVVETLANDKIEQVLDELKDLISIFCNAKCKAWVLDSKNKAFQLIF